MANHVKALEVDLKTSFSLKNSTTHTLLSVSLTHSFLSIIFKMAANITSSSFFIHPNSNPIKKPSKSVLMLANKDSSNTSSSLIRVGSPIKIQKVSSFSFIYDLDPYYYILYKLNCFS